MGIEKEICKLQRTMPIWKKNENLQVAMNYANMKEKWEFACCKELCQYIRKMRIWKLPWPIQIEKNEILQVAMNNANMKEKWEFVSCNELC